MRLVISAVLAWLLLGTGAALAQTPAGSPAPAFTISAEALVLWFKNSAAPPLVSDGVLGDPGTKVLLGGRDIDTNPNPGFRLTSTYALTDRWGVEGSFFYVPPRSTSRSVSSSGQPGSTNLFVPFVDVTLPGESVTPLSSISESFAGKAREELRNSLLGAEVNATMRLSMALPVCVDLLAGFRYVHLSETYTLSTSSPFIPPEPADIYRTKDRFDVSNSFYGPQLGVRARGDWGPLFVNTTVKVAFGAMVQTADIDGKLVTNDFNGFGAPETFVGGVFAQPYNIGNHRRTVFGVVPEAALNIGYQITPGLSVFAGYTFLYANNVIRAPQQINRNLNPIGSAVLTDGSPGPRSGPAEPSFSFNSTDFWAQGLNVGLAYRF